VPVRRDHDVHWVHIEETADLIADLEQALAGSEVE
jgi:hypothetical protein